MIRASCLSDLPRLYELVLAMHAASEYPAREINVSEPTAKALLRDAVMRNGRLNEGGTLLNVVERGGKIEGFMLGILQRVYGIGNRLEAQDFWLYCTPQAPARASARLIDAYLTWALDNPKVADVVLSWTDTAGVDGAKIGKLYKSRGLSRRGEIWKRAGQ
jgi:hypothetical protein